MIQNHFCVPGEGVRDFCVAQTWLRCFLSPRRAGHIPEMCGVVVGLDHKAEPVPTE